MFKVDDLRVQTLSMVTRNDLQRVDIFYTCNRAGHLFLDVYKEEDNIIADIPVVFDSGKGRTTVMLPVQPETFQAVWVLKEKNGNLVAKTSSVWTKPREWTFYAMISSHTDIGLHNSQYIQRYNSSRFLDLAMGLCDETQNRQENDQYRYTMEGTWFWNNYGMDKGKDKAEKLVRDYIKKDKIGVCCGVAGNHTQVYGLEEVCRSTYERQRLLNDWDIDSETMTMIDNNGLSMSLIQPYAEAGIRNLIFGPNQWNPKPSTVWRMDRTKHGDTMNPDAGGGGARIDVRYDSALPLVFYWEDDEKNRMLVWASTSYFDGGIPFGIYPDSKSLWRVEEGMATQLPSLENRYPYDVWLFTCYTDDQEPNMVMTDGIAEWNEKWKWPQIRTLGNPDVPFKRLRDKYSDCIPVLKGDIAGGWYQHPLTTPELLARKFEIDRMLPTAEKWSTIASVLDQTYEYPATLFRRAWDYLLFHDEHSYGVSGYQGRRVYETWMQHRDWLGKAEATAKQESRRALLSIAKQIPSDNETVVVFNPTGLLRRERVLSEDGEKYAMAEVPSLGYRTIKKSAFLPVNKTTEAVDNPPMIENQYYKLSFAENGSILSIYDKELGRELLDLEHPYHANEMLYTKDNHQTYVVPEMATFEIVREEGRTTVIVKTREPNLKTEIVQSVSLLDYEKRIDIDNHLYHVSDMVNKKRYDRYIYYAFPFAVKNGRRYCHLNGAVAEYAKDVTGHGTDVYMAVNEWCCAENSEYGVALMMLDSQLMEFDHIHPDKTDFGDTGEGSWMFVYAANDWLQMHVPGGSHLDYRFRYSITSYEGDYREAEIPQMAERYANPVHVVDISKQDGTLDSEAHSFMSVEGGKRLLCLKRAEDGQGIIARCYGEGSEPTFQNGFGIDFTQKRVSVDESEELDSKPEGNKFVTYRLGEDVLRLTEREEEAAHGAHGAPAAIGSVYTGLITEPCAAAGEHSGHLYLLWGQSMEADFSHYKLYRSETPDFEANEETFLADVMPEEYRVGRYEDTDLKEHTCYYYKVCAVNQKGQCGEMSKVFSGITKETLESVDE